MAPDPCGDDSWWLAHPEKVVIRIARKDQPEEFLKADPEKLQAVLDKAARAFADSSSSPTRPFPESLLRDLESRLKSARPTGDFTGRGKRAR